MRGRNRYAFGGMNFEHMPELQWTWAYPPVPALMLNRF
jgi:Mg2+ and Co2+ transporter CorA